jgi:ESS family glutamate:Na+ symporter
LETAAYHFFNISFISVGLTRDDNQQSSNSNKESGIKGPLWMALTQSAIFPIQAIVGGLVVIAFGLLGITLFPTFGFFVPLGFEEGPGQALSIGKVWQGFGFESATTIGLTFAAMGFFFAFFVGVPLVNWGIRKGLAFHGAKELPRDFLTGVFAKNQTKESAGRLTFHSGNIDTLAFHSACVGVVYIITYAVVLLLGKIIPPDSANILWGFFFIIGLGIAFILRWFTGKGGIDHLLDPGIQRRITGWSVDFLITATIMAIQLVVVWTYIVPISLTAGLGGIATTLVVLFFGKRIWSYNLERTAAIYGTVTGTVSCGLLLLRIVDPEFKTPVAVELALMNVLSIPLIFVCLLLVNGPVWWNWSTALTLLAFAGILALSLALLKIFKLWGKPEF